VLAIIQIAGTRRRRLAYFVRVAGDLALQGTQRVAARVEGADNAPSLDGDRWVEWSFCMARLAEGSGRTLDFGADVGFLALGAAQRGHEVIAFDRLPSALQYAHPSVEAVQGDILDHDFGATRFDQILNCSSVEHVGLGGRYGSQPDPDGDLKAMAVMRDLLAPSGRMLLTVPVGRDQICPPYHRIYGEERLALLLQRYRTDEEQYWVKSDGLWQLADRSTALATEGSERFYSIGLFVLVGAA
jgi:SAM-dependent methyltransferase